MLGSSAKSNEVGVKGAAAPACSAITRSESAYASGNVVLGAVRRRSSHSRAEGGAVVPSTRMDARIRGSIPMATGDPIMASSCSLSRPPRAVYSVRVAASIRPGVSAGRVRGAATATCSGVAAVVFQLTAVRASATTSELWVSSTPRAYTPSSAKPRSAVGTSTVTIRVSPAAMGVVAVCAMTSSVVTLSSLEASHSSSAAVAVNRDRLTSVLMTPASMIELLPLEILMVRCRLSASTGIPNESGATVILTTPGSDVMVEACAAGRAAVIPVRPRRSAMTAPTGLTVMGRP